MLYHDTTGFIHLLSSLIAVATGTMVLIMRKGTRAHTRIGYVYAISMTILLITAFMIYRLFGGFGIFHIAALVSTITLAGGMIPIIRKKPAKNYVFFHFIWMYWSVFGLYGAFVSEVMTRIPETPFFGMVGFATAVVMTTGGFIFSRKKPQWIEEFRVKMGS